MNFCTRITSFPTCLTLSACTLLGLFGFTMGCHSYPTQDRSPKEMVYINLEKATLDEASAAMAIQGIINRDSPRIFVFHGNANRWGRFIGQESANKSEIPPEFRAKYRNTDDLFEEYYVQKRGFKKREIASLDAFFQEFIPRLKGAVRYDINSISQRTVAFSFTSANDYLPVTDDLLKKYPALAGLAVQESLPGKFTDDLELQKWAYETLGSKCTKTAVTSYYPQETWLSIDHGISQRTFFFRLNYKPSENLPEYMLLQRILGDLDAGAALLGWGNGEDAMLAAIASHKVYLQCDPAPNLSFHRSVKPISSVMPPSPAKFDPASVKLEDKYYVAFLINEGDTLKCMGTLYNGGQWFWPQRGQVPINWGTNPAIIENYPAMMEFIHSTMTDKDLFFSSITGYGYYNPKYSLGADYFTSKERETSHLGNINTGSIYSVHNMINATNGIMDAQTDKWLVDRGQEGYVFEASQGSGLQFTSALQPVVGVDWRLFYSHYRFNKGVNTEQAVVDTIKELSQKHAPPFLIPMYAGSPAEFKRIADALPADKFKVVLMDEMMELAKCIGQTQLSRESLTLKGDTARKVTLTVRNWDKIKRGGIISVEAPAHFKITPQTWAYKGLIKTAPLTQEFTIEVPSDFTGADKVVFRDSSNDRRIPLSISRVAKAELPATPALARKVIAARASPVIDGNTVDWEGLPSTTIDHNLQEFNLGTLRASYRLAWDARYLYILVEEKNAPGVINEAYSQREFGGGDFKQVNGVSFWMDFSGKGTTPNGGFAPRFAFSSTGRTDGYICTINDRVLVSSRPNAKVATSGQPGRRVIEAAILWSEIDALLDEEHLPYGGIQPAVKSGFGFGLQPLLIEDKKNQAFLNGFSPGAGSNISVLGAKQGKTGLPSGMDSDSLWVQLQ